MTQCTVMRYSGYASRILGWFTSRVEAAARGALTSPIFRWSRSLCVSAGAANGVTLEVPPVGPERGTV